MAVSPPRKRPPTEKFFEDLARRTGGAIPEEYVSFWRATAGWTLPYSCFLPASRSGRPYSFELTALADIAEAHAHLESSWFRSRLPAAVLPIGATGGEDDTLLLDLTPRHHGRVLAWISARPTRGRTKDALHIVAESFNAYLDSLVLLVADMEDAPRNAKLDGWLATLPAPRTWPGRTAFGAMYAVGREALPRSRRGANRP